MNFLFLAAFLLIWQAKSQISTVYSSDPTYSIALFPITVLNPTNSSFGTGFRRSIIEFTPNYAMTVDYDSVSSTSTTEPTSLHS